MASGSTISGVTLSERCSTSRQTTSSTAKVPKKAAAVHTYFTVTSFHAEVDHHDVHFDAGVPMQGSRVLTCASLRTIEFDPGDGDGTSVLRFGHEPQGS